VPRFVITPGSLIYNNRGSIDFAIMCQVDQLSEAVNSKKTSDCLTIEAFVCVLNFAAYSAAALGRVLKPTEEHLLPSFRPLLHQFTLTCSGTPA
jgi:hypothetical protein